VIETSPATGTHDQHTHRDARAASRIVATPLIRRLARERGIDLTTVRGSGPAGRIVRKDVQPHNQIHA